MGHPGNAADPKTGYGSVAYEFNIGKYEVTIGQYAAFLNSVARTNTNSYIVDLWYVEMMNDLNVAGISRSGSGTPADPFNYSVIAGGNRPIAYVSWFNAARFANWMNNGATNGADTETGAYTLNGATNGVGFTKNPGATWWIPSEDEWYKAAYYKGGGTTSGYWDYPTRSDTAPGNTVGEATKQANYYNVVYSVTQSSDYSETQNYVTDAGAFSGSASSYGTFDQGGNVAEWNDAVIDSSRTLLRGGFWKGGAEYLRSSLRDGQDPARRRDSSGFRLASVASAPITRVILTVETTTNLSSHWQTSPITADMITPAGELNIGALTNTNKFYRLNIRAVVE